jgi:hypothetical protein
MFDERRYKPLGGLLTFLVFAFMLAYNVANELITPDSELKAAGDLANDQSAGS